MQMQILSLILLVCTVFNQNSTSTNYKNYKIKIGAKWYEADEHIDCRELEKFDPVSLQNRKSPNNEANIQISEWSVSNGSFGVSGQGTRPLFCSLQSGSAILICNIKLDNNSLTHQFPTIFRLYLK